MDKSIGATRIRSRLLGFILALLFIPVSAFAQSQRTVTGTVSDETGEPLIGATVQVVGTSVGTATDFDGNYTLKVPATGKQLHVSYVGYNVVTVDITSDVINVSLKPNAAALEEIVVIGYGVQKKDDLTGSVASISEKDFNKGVITTPEELINGKIAGVQITNSGGSPNASSTIRIRGGASLSASNDPLVVIDGVPMEIGGGVEGQANFMSLINPNDIESMTILKDASSTAIYGSRASNGVILITTKKDSGDGIKVSFQTTNSISHKTRTVKSLSHDEFIDVINMYGTDAQKALIGEHNTNWNDEIFQSAFGTDNNLSVSGRAAEWLPFRVSVGAMYQDGILKTDNSTRYTANINLSPTFLDNHLKVQLSGKGTYQNNRFANTGAIWNAYAYDPTQPVYKQWGENEEIPQGRIVGGEFFEVMDNTNGPAQGAIANPVAMLEQYERKSDVYRLIGNIDVDYTAHFLPELRFHLTAGYDYSRGKSKYHSAENNFSDWYNHGSDYETGTQKNDNKLLTIYANYNKELKDIKSTIDVTVGYDYQMWKSRGPETMGYSAMYLHDDGEVKKDYLWTSSAWDERHSLLSYYGRLNYTFDDRYLLTATFRRDGSSRFAKDNRWGTFPSVALAWRVSQENFFEPLRDIINDLKLRASYGITGQQDGIANYFHLLSYTTSQPGAYYLYNGQFIPTIRPEVYNPGLKWETTKSWNFGADFAFLSNRFTASVEYYTRKTEDLLATVPVPAGVNFDKQMLTNVGNVSSKGVEIALTGNIITTKDWDWSATFNATYQKNEITNLSLVEGVVAADTPVGAVESDYIQTLSTGYAPYTFKLYKQIYDSETGRPIEGLYADLNGDGKVTDEDRYKGHNPTPDWIFGFSTSLRFKKWTLSTSLRANVGNYVYNQNAANMGAWECTTWSAGQINNLSESFLDTHFTKRQYTSDHYLENASFLKMDNLQLNYNFGKVYKNISLNVSANVQNVFTITDYSGVDPEVAGGIDSSVYPRPRTYSLTVGLNF